MGEHTERPLSVRTLIASGAVPTNHFVKPTGARCTVHGELAIGISQDGAADGYSVPVVTDGIALIIAGTSLAADIPITTDANGHAIIATTGDIVNGWSINAQTASGALVAIQLAGHDGMEAP